MRTCKFCGSSADEHMLFGCLTVPVASESAEPGEAAKSESAASTCPFCLEDNIHVGACPRLWQTFVPSPTSKRSAAEISTACYFCGLDDHFGGDCKDNTGEHISGRRYALQDDIWNRKYVLQFSDLTKVKSFTGPSVLDTDAASTTVLVVRGSKRQKKAHAGAGDSNNDAQKGGSGSNIKAGPGHDANTKPKRKGRKGKSKVSQSEPSTGATNAGDQSLKLTQDNSNPSEQAKAKGKQAAAEPQVSLPTLPTTATPAPVTDPAATSAPNPISPSTGARDASAAVSSNPKAVPYWMIHKGKAAQSHGEEQGQSQAPDKASAKAERRARAADLQAQQEAKAALKAERRAQHEIQAAAAKKRKAEAAKKKNADGARKKRRRKSQDVEALREKYPPRRRRGRNGDGPGETQGGGEGNAAASS
ncbi:hypothetical protein SPBR_02880 [Sporothrix brasiliensis 5110]|uniref:CCHC-type domain-containing protein n=1 Tax=Sporothrix brasiliensis 5110 TaxID=1398154 RepID=A0A0C2J289_9PEZI|nr:uncharacterized protein SPBR_02880 [Sporothrix brasiliensis 5110]KIH93130.1 hypothetical protein SPBR_02880 [Sporothrix brasiliensis 5110]